MRAACFSGHRPDKLPFLLSVDHPQRTQLARGVERAVADACAEGIGEFICGMAHGFDLFCAGLVLDMRRDGRIPAGVRLVCALPFRGHAYAGEWGKLHTRSLAVCDESFAVSDGYVPGCYHARNRAMVDRSEALICCHDGSEGGTSYTVEYARKKGLRVVNCAAK